MWCSSPVWFCARFLCSSHTTNFSLILERTPGDGMDVEKSSRQAGQPSDSAFNHRIWLAKSSGCPFFGGSFELRCLLTSCHAFLLVYLLSLSSRISFSRCSCSPLQQRLFVRNPRYQLTNCDSLSEYSINVVGRSTTIHDLMVLHMISAQAGFRGPVLIPLDAQVTKFVVQYIWWRFSKVVWRDPSLQLR